MRGQHLIVRLPQYMGDFANRLLDYGYQGWELIYFRGEHAYFMQHGVPIIYNIIKNFSEGRVLAKF